MPIETLERAGELRFEQRDDTKPLTLIGYGAVFYNAADPAGTEYDLGYGITERIMPTAFDKITQDDVRALFNHDPNQVLGRSTAGTLRLVKDARGLAYEIDLPTTSIASNLAESVRRKDVSGSSFSFVHRKIVWVEEAPTDGMAEGRIIRELHDVEVFDVGPVVFPAYTSTTAGMRASDGLPGALRGRTPEERAQSIRAQFDAWKRSQAIERSTAESRGASERARRQRMIRARLLEIELRESAAKASP